MQLKHFILQKLFNSVLHLRLYFYALFFCSADNIKPSFEIQQRMFKCLNFHNKSNVQNIPTHKLTPWKGTPPLARLLDFPCVLQPLGRYRCAGEAKLRRFGAKVRDAGEALNPLYPQNHPTITNVLLVVAPSM